MTEANVTLGLFALGAYIALGLLVGLACVFGGVGRVDPAAKTMPFRARFLILPGLVALWPLILVKLASGKGPPLQ